MLRALKARERIIYWLAIGLQIVGLGCLLYGIVEVLN